MEAGRRLTYAHEILKYNLDEPIRTHSAKYETDLLFYDACENSDWIPRVVLECKQGSVTTHDALTYSTKAETHKKVHPFLRYGILVGAWGGTAVPGRLIRHGAYFDFMMVWEFSEPGAGEWRDFVDLIRLEIEASRRMQMLLMESRTRGRQRFRLLHRPLRLVAADG